jgi:hypothetical protein
VKALGWITPNDAQAGGEATLHVGVRIISGYHIGPLNGPSGANVTSLSMAQSPELTQAGEWALAQSNGLGEVADSAEFILPVRVSRNTTPGIYDIQCTITYTACDPELCWPTQKRELKATLNVTG